MADAFRFHRGGAFHELGKGVVRMVERVAGKRAERLDFARGRQPTTHRRPAAAPPAFHSRRGVHGPQDEWLEHPYRHVIARIQAFHQLIQARDVPRRRLAIGVERLPEFCQQARWELLPLQPHQHFGEQPQFVGGLLHGSDHCAGRAAVAMQKEAVNEQDHQGDIARR